jgi:hypothetical protein
MRSRAVLHRRIRTNARSPASDPAIHWVAQTHWPGGQDHRH